MANKNISGDVNVEFTEAQSRQSLESGESVKTLFGKLRKWLTDLKPVAFSGSYNDLSNKPTIPDISGKVNKSDPTRQYEDMTPSDICAALGYTPADAEEVLSKSGDTVNGSLNIEGEIKAENYAAFSFTYMQGEWTESATFSNVYQAIIRGAAFIHYNTAARGGYTMSITIPLSFRHGGNSVKSYISGMAMVSVDGTLYYEYLTWASDEEYPTISYKEF